MPLDLLQVTQTIPQQFLPYILLFGLFFFAVSLTKISWKIRLGVALAASVALNLYMPSLLSSITTLLNGTIAIGISLVLVAIGFVIGHKTHNQIPKSVPKQSKEIRELEMKRAKLIAQFNSAHGDENKERQISAQVNAVDDHIRKIRLKHGLPV
ncbi:hypothetical protein EPN87_00425 [archaeon]|nr:MAG: hypothetical protein EPN87_00425 [archaeon]